MIASTRRHSIRSRPRPHRPRTAATTCEGGDALEPMRGPRPGVRSVRPLRAHVRARIVECLFPVRRGVPAGYGNVFRVDGAGHRGRHCRLRHCSATRNPPPRSEEHTSELQSRPHLVCRLLLEKKKNTTPPHYPAKKKKNTYKTTP